MVVAERDGLIHVGGKHAGHKEEVPLVNHHVSSNEIVEIEPNQDNGESKEERSLAGAIPMSSELIDLTLPGVPGTPYLSPEMGRVARHCARLANPARFFRPSAYPCVLRYNRNELPPRYPFLSLPFACPFIVLSLGIRAASAGRDARKDAENEEVRLVGGEERLDACLPVGRRKERIQQSLAAQRELLHPREKLPHGTSVGERLHDVA